MEVDLLKQRVVHQHYSDLFLAFRIPEPPALLTVQDRDVRLRLRYRYNELLQRTKSEMLTIYIRTAEAKLEEYTAIYNEDCAQLRGEFSPTQNEVKEDRFRNIDERLEKLYDLKVRFFVEAPTVKRNFI